jgi:hypothetical protein
MSFHLIILGKKKEGGGGFSHKEGGKAAEYLEKLLMAIFLIDLTKKSVITVLHADRTININSCHIILSFSRVGSCIPILSNMQC